MSIPRSALSSKYIHITQRGIGRHLIFEDCVDMRRFLRILLEKLQDSSVEILAWCLMDNHFHLLVNADSDSLSKLMQRLSISYVQYFNGRHGHVGRLFQGRFHARGIKSDAHLLSTIRYIHLNCRDSNCDDPARYSWSSYRECIGCRNVEGIGICHSDQTIAFFGDIESFLRFHEDVCTENASRDFDFAPSRITNHEARRIAVDAMGSDFSDALVAMPRELRNEKLRDLKKLGLSVRQIERLTGIGRGIISRA